ncbi:hypothetical protein AMECASPLE_017107 [Ameca splendens]|uniref:Uncharacterized protein n=1 Tax=Ameca splendens TaxID=208324 RepID=A0ABV0Z1H6_9TELE
MADALTHHFYGGQRSKRSNVTWESLITLSVERFSRSCFLNFVTTTAEQRSRKNIVLTPLPVRVKPPYSAAAF